MDELAKNLDIIDLTGFSTIVAYRYYYCEMENVALTIIASDIIAEDQLYVLRWESPPGDKGGDSHEIYERLEEILMWAQRPSTSSN